MEGGGGVGQGFIKWLSWLSFIIENTISHWNFSLDITLKKLQKLYFWRNKFFFTEKGFCDRKLFCYTYNFLLQKKKSLCHKTNFLCDQNICQRKLFFRKQVFFTETIFFPSLRQQKYFCHRRKKFCLEFFFAIDKRFY